MIVSSPNPVSSTRFSATSAAPERSTAAVGGYEALREPAHAGRALRRPPFRSARRPGKIVDDDAMYAGRAALAFATRSASGRESRAFLTALGKRNDWKIWNNGGALLLSYYTVSEAGRFVPPGFGPRNASCSPKDAIGPRQVPPFAPILRLRGSGTGRATRRRRHCQSRCTSARPVSCYSRPRS